jgi:hypothetical protein
MAAVESTNGGDERQAKKSQEEGRASEAGLSSRSDQRPSDNRTVEIGVTWWHENTGKSCSGGLRYRYKRFEMEETRE